MFVFINFLTTYFMFVSSLKSWTKFHTVRKNIHLFQIDLQIVISLSDSFISLFEILDLSLVHWGPSNFVINIVIQKSSQSLFNLPYKCQACSTPQMSLMSETFYLLQIQHNFLPDRNMLAYDAEKQVSLIALLGNV